VTIAPTGSAPNRDQQLDDQRRFAMTDAGPLTQKVIQYQDTVRQLVPTVKAPEDWAPLGDLIATDHFARIGTFMETQDWPQYAEMLTGWANSVDSFDTTVKRITEAGNLVYFEIEERHYFAGNAHTVNSMTVFEFDDDAKIRRVAVYLQQPA
jgi:hypothetical protein